MKKILIMLTLLWMAVIFCFSSHTGEESSDDSDFVGEFIGSIVVDDFKKLPAEEQEKYLDKISFAVRKTAHGTEYMILGILLCLTGLCYGKHRGITASVCIVIGSIYALSDEIHQYFVPGRACAALDWLIDTGGVIAGVLTALILSSAVHAGTGRKNGREMI